MAVVFLRDIRHFSANILFGAEKVSFPRRKWKVADVIVRETFDKDGEF